MAKVQANILDRAIAYVAPTYGAKRMAARGMMAVQGGYTGGQYTERMSYWQPGNGDADADTTRDLRELRARSRDLVRNSPIAGGAIETQVSHVVGTGLQLQARIGARRLGMTTEQASQWQAETEELFRMWCESQFADASGELNFWELQDLAFRSRLESGDSFVVLASKRRSGWPFTLALNVVEADRVSNPQHAADSETMVKGIEKDADGAPVAVYFADRHPGRTLSQSQAGKWTRVPFRGDRSGRRNVLHLTRKLRPGQTRGVPELAPIIETIKQLTRYSVAEVDAAVNSAALALFARMDPEAFGELFTDEARASYIESAQRWDGTVQSGSVVNLLPGEEISSPVQNRPNPNFDPFVQGMMVQVGMALNIPKEVLTKHFQSSYSAARAALLDAWRLFRIRRQWLAAKLCQPVYEEWLADAVATGLVSAPGFFGDPIVRAAWCGATWSGDGPGSIDPEKEANAAQARMDAGLSTLSEEIAAYDGGDWEQKHQQQVRERQARERDGLAAPVTQPKAAPAAGTPGQPGQGNSNGSS